jgi:hypothetical protein
LMRLPVDNLSIAVDSSMLADREPFWARRAPTFVLMTVTVGSFPALNRGDLSKP